MTSYFDHKKIHPDSISYYLQKSLNEAKQIDDTTGKVPKAYKYDMIILLHGNLGLYYMEISNPPNMKLAEKNFLAALKINEDTGGIMHNKVALFSSVGRFYMTIGKSKEAIAYSLQSLEFEKSASSPYDRLNTYEILSKVYLDTSNKQLSKKYLDLYTKLDDSIKISEKHAVDSSIKKMISEEKNTNAKKRNLIIDIAIIILLISSIIVFLLWKHQSKKVLENYTRIIKKLKTEKNPTEIPKVYEEAQTSKENLNFEIPGETISVLLQKLEKFEASDRYLKNNVDLSSLSYQLNTNSKYLSEIIKQYKGKSFTSYINGLRICYITKKLYEDPQFSLYKISYLAEISGFSSRDVFTSVFKKETGITPSYFISQLKVDKLG